MDQPFSRPRPYESEEIWINFCRTWDRLQEQGSGFLPKFELTKPLLEDALRGISSRFFYLVDEASFMMKILAKIEGQSLPSSPQIARIHLDSISLRLVKEELREKSSSLFDPLAPWHQFRIRHNSLRRSFRMYFLAPLQPVNKARHLVQTSKRFPNQHWLRLWIELTEDIPRSCLPAAWCEIADRASYSTIRSQDVAWPHLLVPSRSVASKIAVAFHRAAALVESRTVGQSELLLPEGVVPKSIVQFSKGFQKTLDSFGGIPREDSRIHEAAGYILELQSGDERLVNCFDAKKLVSLSAELGFDAFKSHMLLGATHDRGGNSEQAKWEFQKGLQKADSIEKIADALANMAIQALLAGRMSEAQNWIREALSYQPQRRFVQECAIAIRSAQSFHGDAQSA